MTTLWRHKKRGTVYEVITDHAKIQCATHPSIEEKMGSEDLTVYRNVRDWSIWVRPTKEFMDGRFEIVEELSK